MLKCEKVKVFIVITLLVRSLSPMSHHSQGCLNMASYVYIIQDQKHMKQSMTMCDFY